MLTAYQCEVLGAYTEDGLVCLDCATRLAGEKASDPEVLEALLRGEHVDLGIHTFIRYELDEYQGDDEDAALHGIYCVDCGAELAEPWDLRDVHDGFHYDKWSKQPEWCEYCAKEEEEYSLDKEEGEEEEDNNVVLPWVDEDGQEWDQDDLDWNREEES